MDPKIFIIGLAICIGVLVVIMAILMILEKRKNGKISIAERKTNRAAERQYNALYFVQRIFKTTPVLKNYYRNIKRRVQIIYPTDTFTVDNMTSGIIGKGLLGGIACIGFTVVVSGGNVFFILCGITVAYIIMSAMVNTRLNHCNQQLLKELQMAIDYIGTVYDQKHNLMHALRAAIEEMPPLVSLHIARIYDIVKSPKMKEEIDKYLGTEPNRYMNIFLSICSSYKEYGDTKQEDGTSVLMKNLEYLRDSVDAELLAIDKTNEAFKSHEFIAVFPIIFLKPLEKFIGMITEGNSTYFTGITGLVSMIIVFGTAILTHMMIVILRDGTEELGSEENIWSAIANLPILHPIIVCVVEKNFTRYDKYNDLQKGIGDRTGTYALLAKQISLAVATFVLIITLFAAGVISDLSECKNEWAEDIQMSNLPSEEYLEMMEETGKGYFKDVRKNRDKYDQVTLANSIKETSALKSDAYADALATIILNKVDKYNKIYFRFWYMVVAAAGAVIAFIGPVIMLNFKAKVAEMRKQEEVIMFQTLILILMHIKGVNVRTILEWMERFSFCFRDTISECRTAIYHGKQAALLDMKNRESFVPFRSFCDSLLAIDDVGVEKAFSSINSSYSYNVKKREQYIQANINQKSTISGFASMGTFWATFIFYILVPFAMYAINLYSSFSNVIG